MSEDLQKKVETLAVENANLTAQLNQHKQALDGMMAQLDAHREQLNENLNTGMQLRTNLIFVKKQNATLTKQNEEWQNKLNAVNKQLEDATKRIADLELEAVTP